MKGKGVHPIKGPAGDLRVTLKIVLPDPEDEALKEALSNWRATHGYDARKGWKGNTA